MITNTEVKTITPISYNICPHCNTVQFIYIISYIKNKQKGIVIGCKQCIKDRTEINIKKQS